MQEFKVGERQRIFIGENIHYRAQDFVVGYHILEEAQQQADNECGELSADWLDSILHERAIRR